MRRISYFFLLFFAFAPLPLLAQGTAFTAKGGLTIGTQRWNGADASLARFSYHAAGAFEFLTGWKDTKKVGERVNKRQTIFGVGLGLHNKGNAVRVRFQDPNNNSIFVREQLSNSFTNLSALFFAKGAHLSGTQTEVYYLMGLRIDYTVQFALLTQGIDPYVNRLNYGLTLGGGMTYYIPNSRFGIFLEASISPDISRQLYVPAGIPIVYQADGRTYSYPSSELRVHNLILELSLGFKILPPVYEPEPEDEEVF